MAQFSQSIDVGSYAGLTVRNTLTGQEGQTKLMVLLPGQGYTVAAPLLHYMRRLGGSLGYDVLSVTYGFQAAQQTFKGQDLPAIQQESRQAIQQALALGYQEMVVVGKSLGTPIAAQFANEFPEVSKAILLTPIRSCHRLIQKVPALAIIGTADPVWEAGLAVDTDLVTWRVFDNVNHSLEFADDVMASIEVLGAVMAACKDFLQA